jgi:hypothetical protein
VYVHPIANHFVQNKPQHFLHQRHSHVYQVDIHIPQVPLVNLPPRCILSDGIWKSFWKMKSPITGYQHRDSFSFAGLTTHFASFEVLCSRKSPLNFWCCEAIWMSKPITHSTAYVYRRQPTKIWCSIVQVPLLTYCGTSPNNPIYITKMLGKSLIITIANAGWSVFVPPWRVSELIKSLPIDRKHCCSKIPMPKANWILENPTLVAPSVYLIHAHISCTRIPNIVQATWIPRITSRQY